MFAIGMLNETYHTHDIFLCQSDIFDDTYLTQKMIFLKHRLDNMLQTCCVEMVKTCGIIKASTHGQILNLKQHLYLSDT